MSQTNLPLGDIYVLPDFNPRLHFDEASLNELAGSIKRKGVIQPIVVRREPTDEGTYHLVAGERRFRASRLAGLKEIPAVVRDCSLVEAREIAIAENEQREGVSAGEEALAAQKVLDALEGDKGLAAKELGWSRTKLDSRLLLLHADRAVLDELAKGNIRIGHAELLSGLPAESQKGTLRKVIENKVSVAELSQKIEGFAYPLASACFDTAECNGCPHNSETQKSLFSEPVKSGLCQNRSCFNTKTQAALEAKRSELSDDYNVVILATEKPEVECRPLEKEGPTGVGPSQFAACQQCASFGARIENRLNGKTGQVVEGLCLDVGCNDAKQAAFRQTLEVKEAPAGKSATSSKKGPGAAKASGKASAGSATADLPKAAKVAISSQVRSRMPEVVLDSESVRRALIVEALNRQSPATLDEDALKAAKLPGKLSSSLSGSGPSLATLVAATPDDLDRLIDVHLASIAKAEAVGNGYNPDGYAAEQVRRSMTILDQVKKPVSDMFQVNDTFLAALPKAAISSLLDEVGFRSWFVKQSGEDREKAYKALLALKKADLPKAIMAEGFDWSGVVPKQVQAFLKKP